MASRSIYAQIDEVRELVEQRRRETLRARGRDESVATEHLLRLECALKTLEWVRDHQDDIKAMVATRRTAG